MEQQEFKQLVQSFLEESISKTQLELLLAEIKAGRNIHALDAAIAEKLAAKAFYGQEAGVGEEEMFNATMRKAAEAQATAKIVNMPARSYNPVIRFVAAAVILFALAAGGYFVFFNNKNTQLASVKPVLQNDIAPGGNKATLTLADGSVVVLNDQQNGTLLNQGNTKVIKLGDGRVAYNGANAANGQAAYNTIATPRGGKYQVALADGSQVWLNAASSIRFPAAFTGKERDVEITGEVYFEVAKNKAMPFVVKTGGVKVQVLGTHFNVMSYTDEATVKTTLLEGSVKVLNGASTTVIKPGQQAKINSGAKGIVVQDNVDTDETIAWKNDLFIFNNAGIETIMRQIARWYDVEVSYDGPVTTDHFTGKVSRNSTAAQVLKILELSDIHFTITGKKIIVKS
jgi:transmembrane sensor